MGGEEEREGNVDYLDGNGTKGRTQGRFSGFENSLTLTLTLTLKIMLWQFDLACLNFWSRAYPPIWLVFFSSFGNFQNTRMYTRAHARAYTHTDTHRHTLTHSLTLTHIHTHTIKGGSAHFIAFCILALGQKDRKIIHKKLYNGIAVSPSCSSSCTTAVC